MDMRIRCYGGFLAVLTAAVVGCGSKVAPPSEETVAPDLTTHLDDKVEFSVADWLKQPRADLAKLADEWADTVRKQQDAARNDKDLANLLPKLCPPVAIPVFRDAKFSSTAGFSMPPYLKAGDKDADVALHLARFGDHEAALKLADPSNKELRTKIDSFRAERNYPVEWTRLVSLVLTSAQFKLANGEKDGATELVVLHRQLRKVLDKQAAGGPLGSVLLGQGRRALQEAAAAWRQPSRNRAGLAGDVENALAAWGDVPAPTVVLAPGTKIDEVRRILQGKVDGRTVTPKTTADAQRSFDLLALPLPAQSVDRVVAFLDDKKTLTDLLVVYKAKTNLVFPEPANLAHLLIDHAYTSDKEKPANAGVQHEMYSGNGKVFDVTLLSRGTAFGAVVRVGDPKAPAANCPRELGAVHFDQTFTSTRVAVSPDQNKDPLKLGPKELAKIKIPAADTASDAVLQRVDGRNLLASVTLHWSSELNNEAVEKLALPFWGAFGSSRFEATDEHLALIWEDAPTRFTLRLPYDVAVAPEFVAEDQRGAEDAAKREEAAVSFDRKRRQARLAAGKPNSRINRSLTVEVAGGVNLGVSLGMTKAQVQAVPTGKHVRKFDIPGGVSFLCLNPAPGTVTHWARQIFVRFGADDRVAELRVRYQEGPKEESRAAPSLLTRLKSSGAPEQLPSTWAGLWPELEARKPAATLYRWSDDLTLLTCNRDADGAEVALRDCPADHPEGAPLPPLEFCKRGLKDCNLGDKEEAIVKALKIEKPAHAGDGALVVPQPSSSAYDVVLVYFEEGKAVRILARHRSKAALQADEVRPALQQAWSRDIQSLGDIRRQDKPRGPATQSYGWHDDRTRVRMFAHEGNDGLRLFTEWRDWPVVQKETVAAKE
jgi:hypothetical protein